MGMPDNLRGNQIIFGDSTLSYQVYQHNTSTPKKNCEKNFNKNLNISIILDIDLRPHPGANPRDTVAYSESQCSREDSYQIPSRYLKPVRRYKSWKNQKKL